jgi:hypothetical protein
MRWYRRLLGEKEFEENSTVDSRNGELIRTVA